jgi:ribose/xylose/arabinose/galactoside ABC-type transport system permease subunit
MTRGLRPLAATAIIFAVTYAISVAQFPGIWSTRVLGNFLTDNAFLGITAVGMTFVILSGGINLSVWAVIGLVGVMIEWLNIPPIMAFAVALTVAALFGAEMGCVIHYLEVPAFVATLAGMFLARGVASVITQDSIPINHALSSVVEQMFYKLPGGGRISATGVLMVAVFVIGAVIAHRTKFGSNVYAMGGNPTSAALMGVPLARTTVLVYTLSGFLAGLAGIVFSFYTSAGYSLAASGVELDAIGAVVIGGTLLTGGPGFVLGTFIGVMMMGLVQTYIIFDGTLSSWWTKNVVGFLLFMFILLQRVAFATTASRTG